LFNLSLIKNQLVIAGNPIKISLTLLPNAIENDVSELKPTKSPTITKASS